MCVLADKYDIKPLKAMAVSAFKVSVSAIPVKVSELAGAATLAYDAHGATEEIRKTIVDTGIDGKLLSTTCDNALGDVMTQYSVLAKEYAQALEGKLAKLQDLQSVQAKAQNIPERYHCPTGCGGTKVVDSTAGSNSHYQCYFCDKTYTAQVWRSQRIIR